MATATKKALSLFILPILMVTLPTMSMKKHSPQLQLENPQKPIDIIRVNCSIMIADGTDQTTMYAMKKVHTAIFEHSKVQSTMKDPIIFFHVQKNSADNQFYLPLPAKLFINVTDKSIIQIHETDGFKL